MIKFFIIANLQGQSRLSQYYEYMPQDKRTQFEAEVVRRCVSRNPKQVYNN